MKVVAAYLLANLGGNASPSADDIKKILSSGELHTMNIGTKFYSQDPVAHARCGVPPPVLSSMIILYASFRVL